MWIIPDPIDDVTEAPYDDDMTVSFDISGQAYTMKYRTMREAKQMLGNGCTNIALMEWVLRQPRRFGLVRYVPAPIAYPPGFVYVVERGD